MLRTTQSSGVLPNGPRLLTVLQLLRTAGVFCHPLDAIPLRNLRGGGGSKDVHLENFSVSNGGKDLIENANAMFAFGRRYGLVRGNCHVENFARGRPWPVANALLLLPLLCRAVFVLGRKLGLVGGGLLQFVTTAVDVQP